MGVGGTWVLPSQAFDITVMSYQHPVWSLFFLDARKARTPKTVAVAVTRERDIAK